MLYQKRYRQKTPTRKEKMIFEHEIQDVNLIITSLEHKIRDMQLLVQKLMAKASEQMPAPALATALTESPTETTPNN